MQKIEFGFGVGLDADGKEISEASQQTGLAAIREGAVTWFGGCTLCQTVGDWRDPETNKCFSECGMTLSVLITPEQQIFGLESLIVSLAEIIKDRLNQKAVYVTRYPVESKLY